MVCPNDSPSSRDFLTLVNNGSPPTPEKRRILYYTICIMLRLLIAGIVLQYCDSLPMQSIVCIATAISALYLFFVRKDTTQWWSSSFQTGIAISLFLVSATLIMWRVVIPIQIIVCIASAITASYLLFARKNTTQWWFQMGIAISLFVASAILIITRMISNKTDYVHFREVSSYALPALLYLSVIGGFMQSLRVKSC